MATVIDYNEAAIIDYDQSSPPANWYDDLTDLDSIKRQIRIARLKLGSILDSFDRIETIPAQIDAIADTTGDVAAAIDNLVVVLGGQERQYGDDTGR